MTVGTMASIAAIIGRAPRHRHSPRVRRLAAEAGIDPDVVLGTGPNGRVRPGDVAAFVGASAVLGTYVIELDLAAVPGAIGDRSVVVGEIAFGLVEGLRDHFPIVDVEIVSGDRRVFVHDGRNGERIVITVIDGQGLGDVVCVAPVVGNRMLTAVIGPTTRESGAAGATALLAVLAGSRDLASTAGMASSPGATGMAGPTRAANTAGSADAAGSASTAQPALLADVMRGLRSRLSRGVSGSGRG